METFRESAKDAGLSPVQQGVKRGLKGLYDADEMLSSSRIDELMNMGTLAANLESGLAAFEYSCDNVGQLD